MLVFGAERQRPRNGGWITKAAKQAVLTFITDVSRAGTYKRYVNEPRKQLLVLAKLCERGRATAHFGPPAAFPARPAHRRRDDGGSFQRASGSAPHAPRRQRGRPCCGLSLDGEDGARRSFPSGARRATVPPCDVQTARISCPLTHTPSSPPPRPAGRAARPCPSAARATRSRPQS